MKKSILTLLIFFACVLYYGGEAYAAATSREIDATQLTITVKGKVVDELGEPIIGASLVEKGTMNAVATDLDGNFTINVAEGAILEVSSIGYKKLEVKADSDSMRIVLKTDVTVLDEVVVVGYGQQKKVNLTGAVSTVDLGKTMEGRPLPDLGKALQGAVPGLTVTQSSGALDGRASMRIRGIGTLSNSAVSNPLFVVDGVPMDDISFINTQDIESISVLKDAASSSIYGTRAAFGVILIQTKGAKEQGRVSVTYQNNFSWDQATFIPEFPDVPSQLRAALEGKANAGQYEVELFGMYFDKMLPLAEAWKEQHGNKKKGYSEMQPYVDANNVGDWKLDGRTPYYYADYDVAGIYFDKAAPSQSHNVAVSGTSGNTNYHLSYGYDAKQGLFKLHPDKLKKYNFAVNVTTNVKKWLQVGARVNFSRRYYQRPETWNNIYQYIYRWGSFFLPSGYFVGEDGEHYDHKYIAILKQASERRLTLDQTRMTGFAKATIFKGFTVNADYTYQINNMNSGMEDFSIWGINWASYRPGWIVKPTNTAIWRDYSKSNTWTLNVFANYQHTFNKVHNLNVMFGVNAEESEYHYLYGGRKRLLDESYPELNMASQDGQTVDWAHSSRAAAGYFGRINYDYKGRYLIELNGRYDGSSRFPHNSHWAFFPSGSIGWRFSEEPFFESLKHIINHGKVRASFGEIGNEAIGNYMFEELISERSAGSSLWIDGNNKLTQYNMPKLVSKSLTWERIRTTDVGMDLHFLENAIILGFDWFQRENIDMLAPDQILPSAMGAGAPYANAGNLRTRGWELSLNVRHRFGEVETYANFSISDSKTKIMKWKNDTKALNTYYEGKTFGDIWGFETDRYFEENDFTGRNADGSWNYASGIPDQSGLESAAFHYGPGDIKYADLNGDGKIDGGKGTANDHGDLKVIGNALPRYEYAFHLGAAWKGLDIDLFFQGVGKRDAWETSSLNFPLMVHADIALYSNQTSYNKVIYSPDYKDIQGYEIDQNNDYPRLYPGNNVGGTVPGIATGRFNYYPQTRYLINQSYLRLKNVTIGYTLPKSLTRKVSIENCRVYFSGNNLFLFHKGHNLPVDPEIAAGAGPGGWGRIAPITRTLSFGIQVTL